MHAQTTRGVAQEASRSREPSGHDGRRGRWWAGECRSLGCTSRHARCDGRWWAGECRPRGRAAFIQLLVGWRMPPPRLPPVGRRMPPPWPARPTVRQLHGGTTYLPRGTT